MPRKPRKKGKLRRQHAITRIKILSIDEYEAFKTHILKRADTVAGKRRKIICDLLLNSGLRVSEVCALRVQDTPFVLDEDFVSVYIGKNYKDGDVAISARLAKALTNYIKNIRPKTLPRYVRRSDFSKPVFYSQRCRPYTENGIYRLVRTAGERAGIRKRITPHKLRHTYATFALVNGMDLRSLQSQMRHADISMTEKYTHVVNTYLKKLADQVDRDFETPSLLF